MWSFFKEIKNTSDSQDFLATKTAVIPTYLLKRHRSRPARLQTVLAEHDGPGWR